MVRKATISTFNFHYCAVDPNGTVEDHVNSVMLFLESKINRVLPDRPDLIVLPECCDMPAGCTGEKLQAYYRVRGDRILRGLSDLAVRHRCYIAYPSVRILEDGTRRNSVRLIDRNGGVVGIYDKNHPVIVEMEEEGILCGNEATVFICDFGTVGCAICFDLNFEPLRAKYAAERPDLIIFPSMFHGGFVQQHWAYSCRAHFVGAIAGGLPSSIISPVGQWIGTTTSYFDYRSDTVNLDCAVVHLDNNRERLEAMRSKYGTKVKVTDPGYLGSVLISSETDECTIDGLIREFAFELLDDYLSRSLACHRNNAEQR